jgi:hypothetical protein
MRKKPRVENLVTLLRVYIVAKYQLRCKKIAHTVNAPLFCSLKIYSTLLELPNGFSVFEFLIIPICVFFRLSLKDVEQRINGLIYARVSLGGIKMTATQECCADGPVSYMPG